MGGTKITNFQKNDILMLYYNGFVNIDRISQIVNCSSVAVNRIIDESFTRRKKYYKEYLIIESKINYANNN